MDSERLAEEIRRRDAEIMRLIGERNAIASKMDAGGIRQLEKSLVDDFMRVASESGMDESVCKTIATAFSEQAAISLPPVRTADPKRVAIVGGAGKMGKWTGDFLSASGHAVTVIDPASGNGKTLKDCSDADVVIVSVPIHATASVIKELDEICRKDALIFDLASLKSTITDILRDMSGRRKVCSIHPMFGPSAKSISGRNLIICDCGNPRAVNEAKELFDWRGGNIRTMYIEHHDEYMSYVLGLSHAVNIAFFTVLERSGITFSDMQTVASTTFRKNMDTNASVALEDPQLYYEIQHLNRNRDEMWNLFSEAVEDLKEASLSDDPSEFVDLMHKGRDYFS